MKKLLLLMMPILLGGCAKNIDLKKPEFTKSPCACTKIEWGEKRVNDNA